MPKIITAKRAENEIDLARRYVKTHILFPSALLGAIMMLSGMASLVYQFMFETYEWRTFAESTALVFAGGLLGYIQTRYHRYVLRDHPHYFAARLRTFSRTSHKRSKKEMAIQIPEHPGQRVVPFFYLAGLLLLLGASAASAMYGHVYYMAALLMPWAGFFWAKMFFWREILAPMKGGK